MTTQNFAVQQSVINENSIVYKHKIKSKKCYVHKIYHFHRLFGLLNCKALKLRLPQDGCFDIMCKGSIILCKNRKLCFPSTLFSGRLPVRCITRTGTKMQSKIVVATVLYASVAGTSHLPVRDHAIFTRKIVRINSHRIFYKLNTR